MEELVDVLDENTGELTGQTITKQEAQKKGYWYGSIHLLIINNNKTLLKKIYKDDQESNIWNIPLDKYIEAGKTAIDIIKEFLNELKLNTLKYKLYEIKKNNEKKEFQTIFIINENIYVENENFKWHNKEELNNLINTKSIISHTREFEILNDILKTTFK